MAYSSLSLEMVPNIQSDTKVITVDTKRNLLEKWIPALNNIEKIELFNVVKSYNITYTKNKNGIFFNLACLEDSVIDRLYTFCEFYRKNKEIAETISEQPNGGDLKTESLFNAIDKSIMLECVRDVIKCSISKDLQEKLNKKLSTLSKESNWKHTPLPSNHTKNAELGKVRGRIVKRKNNILKRCRDISLYLTKNSNKDTDTLSATNELEAD